MARDLDKMYASNQEWHDANTTLWTVRVRNDSGVPTVLNRYLKAHEDAGLTRNAFIREAIEEKLAKEGYLPGEFSYEMRTEADGYGIAIAEFAAMAIDNIRSIPGNEGMSPIDAVREYIHQNHPEN